MYFNLPKPVLPRCSQGSNIFFQSQPNFARQGAALLGLICYIYIYIYIRYPSSYPRLSGDLLLPSLCHCALRRLSAVIWDETLLDSMLGTLVATFDHPSESIAYIRNPPICSTLVFQPIFLTKIGYGWYGCNFLNLILSFWQIARLFALRQEWGLVLPDLWGIGFLPRWNDGVPWRSGEVAGRSLNVATCRHCHIASCILSIRIIVASYMMYIYI